MSGILPFAITEHPVWTPLGREIHVAIWQRVGLKIVQGHVRAWSKNWSAKAQKFAAEQEKQSEPRKNDADWSPMLPPLPLPPSNESISVTEKWASLAAIQDVFGFTGDKVLPWPLPDDDLDLVAFTEWLKGDSGAYQLLLRKASELAESHADTVRGWLHNFAKEKKPPKPSAKETLKAARIETLKKFLSDAKTYQEYLKWKGNNQARTLPQYASRLNITDIKQLQTRYHQQTSQGWTIKNVTAELNRKQDSSYS